MDNKNVNRQIGECIGCTLPQEIKKELCSYCMAQRIVKGKWKLLIIWHLKSCEKRFSELLKNIPATPSSLTKQLRELEADGIINRKVYNVIPPKVEYSLSEVGEQFLGVMDAMKIWGTQYMNHVIFSNLDSEESKLLKKTI